MSPPVVPESEEPESVEPESVEPESVEPESVEPESVELLPLEPLLLLELLSLELLLVASVVELLLEPVESAGGPLLLESEELLEPVAVESCPLLDEAVVGPELVLASPESELPRVVTSWGTPLQAAGSRPAATRTARRIVEGIEADALMGSA